MELYHNKMSTCAQKVRLVLAEKRLAPIMRHLNLRAGEAQTPEYIALNPGGVVPTLIDKGQPIIESAVICEYLDDAYPTPPLRPADPIERARMRLWTHKPDAWLHKSIGETSFSIAFRHQMTPEALAAIKDPAKRAYREKMVRLGFDMPGVEESVKGCGRLIQQMSQALSSSPWLAGPEYSLADIAMLPYVERLEHLQLSFLWEGQAQFADWLARSRSRASYAAIMDYLDASYLDLMREQGRMHQARLRQWLGFEGT